MLPKKADRRKQAADGRLWVSLRFALNRTRGRLVGVRRRALRRNCPSGDSAAAVADAIRWGAPRPNNHSSAEIFENGFRRFRKVTRDFGRRHLRHSICSMWRFRERDRLIQYNIVVFAAFGRIRLASIYSPLARLFDFVVIPTTALQAGVPRWITLATDSTDTSLIAARHEFPAR
jgi:hypothetical protein